MFRGESVIVSLRQYTQSTEKAQTGKASLCTCVRGRRVRLRVGKLDESGSDTILNEIVELLLISQLVESNSWIK